MLGEYGVLMGGATGQAGGGGSWLDVSGLPDWIQPIASQPAAQWLAVIAVAFFLFRIAFKR